MELSERNKTILRKQLVDIPDVLQRTLTDGTIRAITDSLKTKHSLSKHQIAIIENELVLVILLLKPFASLQTNITKEAAVDSQLSQEIISDLQTSLPKQVLDILILAEQIQLDIDAGITPAFVSDVHESKPIESIEMSSTGQETLPPQKETVMAVTKAPTPAEDASTQQKKTEFQNQTPRYAKPFTDAPRYDEETST